MKRPRNECYTAFAFGRCTEPKRLAGAQADETDATVAEQAAKLRIALGQDDLVPYRLEYHHAPSIDQSAKTVVMELFEVQLGVPIDAHFFVFRPGKLPVRDTTEAFLAERFPGIR